MSYFGIMEFLFPIFFLTVFGIIIFGFISNIRRGIKNNNSPRLSVTATVVTKREHNSHTRNNVNNMEHFSSYTTYYATFEVESGDRMELNIPSDEYGYLLEGDTGILSFQGTRFISFERR